MTELVVALFHCSNFRDRLWKDFGCLNNWIVMSMDVIKIATNLIDLVTWPRIDLLNEVEHDLVSRDS